MNVSVPIFYICVCLIYAAAASTFSGFLSRVFLLFAVLIVFLWIREAIVCAIDRRYRNNARIFPEPHARKRNLARYKEMHP